MVCAPVRSIIPSPKLGDYLFVQAHKPCSISYKCFCLMLLFFSLSDVDGMWSQWGAWVETACSASCCGGTKDRTRNRACDNPPPAGTGMNCPGAMAEIDSNVPCNEQVCPCKYI